MTTPQPAPSPTIFGKEPAALIGILASVVLAVVSVLVTNGVLNQALAGKITDTVGALTQILTILAPFIASLLIRTQVTPVAAPSLPSGTTVTVITPPTTANTTTTV